MQYAGNLTWWTIDKKLENLSIAVGYYRPQTKLRQGNIFTPVCQSFCSQVWGVCSTPVGRPWGVGQNPWTQTPQADPLGRPGCRPPGRPPPMQTPLGRPPWMQTPLGSPPGQTPQMQSSWMQIPLDADLSGCRLPRADSPGCNPPPEIGQHPTGMHTCFKFECKPALPSIVLAEPCSENRE